MQSPKRYCTLHGTAQFVNQTCSRCQPVLHKLYVNIVLVSTTQMKLSSIGNPMPNIGEVISEFLVDTSERIEHRRIVLECEHEAFVAVHYL